MGRSTYEIKPTQPKALLLNVNGKMTLSREDLRDQLKAHLSWCAYLGTTIDEEKFTDLVVMLRQTADIMHSLANLVETHTPDCA